MSTLPSNDSWLTQYASNPHRRSGRHEPPVLENACRRVLNWMEDGYLVPFLGAGVNLSCREPQFIPHANLPSGGELAEHLFKKAKEREASHPKGESCRLTGKEGLLLTAEYFRRYAKDHQLYDELHDVFANGDFRPAPAHIYLARLAKLKADSPREGMPYQIIVTTNYDRVLESTFDLVGLDYDVVWYDVTTRPHRYLHRSYGPSVGLQPQRAIDRPNEYDKLPLDQDFRPTRTIILKIHGAIDPRGPRSSSFVISQSDYISFLAGMTGSPLPSFLTAALQKASFLFLGYSLGDWNMQVLLKRLTENENLETESLAVMLDVSDVEQYIWDKMGVQILDASIEDFVEELERQRPSALWSPK